MEYTYEFLRKFHGLRFRAKFYHKQAEGVVKVEDRLVRLCHGEEKLGFPDNFNRPSNLTIREGIFPSFITDFEIVPRDPETYKDWQIGDVICNLGDEWYIVNGENETCRVIFRSGELVVRAGNCSDEEAEALGPYTCSQLFREGWRLVLSDVEKEILERKVVEDTPKPYEFKKGNLVLTRNDRSAEWKLRVFEGRVDGSDRQFKASVDGCLYIYQHCIPYNEETMHLLGMTDDYEEGK